MRTTLTRMLEEEMHRQRKSFKEVVNEALRRGLTGKPSSSRAAPFRVRVHHSALKPGFDRVGFNKLADELEDAAVLAKRARE